MSKIKLGDKVRDRVTGFEGIATSKTEFLNGCIQIEITPRLKPGETIDPEKMVAGLGLDIGQLEKVDCGLNTKKPIVRKKTGGPMRKIRRNLY